jgi:hypothetical protein
MRCYEFDGNIEEILSGAVMPEADEHMRECERCTSRFRARTAVKNGLRHLAAAPVTGPSRATDRAVMQAYRSLQLDPVGEPATRPAAQGARLLSFPRVPVLSMRPQAWMSGAAVAAVAVAVLGVGLYRSNSISPALNHPHAGASPAIAAAPSAPASEALAESSPMAQSGTARAVVSERATALAARVSPHLSVSQNAPAAPAAVLAKQSVAIPASTRTEVASAAVAAEPQTQVESPAAASPVLHLASTGAPHAGAAVAGAPLEVGVERAPSVGGTWPGYSNLMYCDPVVCSGPMPVVRVRVPVQQAAPAADPGGGTGESYVNADVVIGPDGVARAIRVAN